MESRACHALLGRGGAHAPRRLVSPLPVLCLLHAAPGLAIANRVADLSYGKCHGAPASPAARARPRSFRGAPLGGFATHPALCMLAVDPLPTMCWACST